MSNPESQGSSARSYWAVCPALSWPLSQGQGSWSSPGRVDSNSPLTAGTSPGVWGIYRHTHSLSLPSLFLTCFFLLRAEAWKLNLGCKSVSRAVGLFPGGSDSFKEGQSLAPRADTPSLGGIWGGGGKPRSLGVRTWECGFLLRSLGALSRTDGAEYLFSNGI